MAKARAFVFTPDFEMVLMVSPKEERIYLMAAAQPSRDVALMMFELGLRPSEIFELTRKDVNLKDGWLQVQKGKT